MKKNHFYPRSDFADEGLAQVSENALMKQIYRDDEKMKVTWIKVLNENNEFHKSVGDYVTLQFERMDDALLRQIISEQLVEILKKMTQDIAIEKILIVGLGNEEMISDAIGPKMISQILVSAHFFELEDHVQEGIANCAAIAPKVMGQTGLESARIVKGIADFYQPDLIIAVDALATDTYARINRVIQISDTGIQPGSGVGNHRLAINQEVMQVPVISLGVATVTTIGAIVNDILNEEVDLDHEHLNCIVTPRNIDVECAQIVSILSFALNCFVHPAYQQL